MNRCLAKNPNQRYRSAGELAQALAAVQETVPQSAGLQPVGVSPAPPIAMPRVIEKEVIKEILVERHQFSMQRVEKQLEKLKVLKKKAGQKTLF